MRSSRGVRDGRRASQERGGDSHRSSHYQLSAGASCRLHQTFHVARNLHHDQGAGKAETRGLHLHESPQHGDLDVRGVRLHRSEHCVVPCEQVGDE